MQQVSLLGGNASLAFLQSLLLGSPSLLLHLLFLLGFGIWVGADGVMGLLVDSFQRFGGDSGGDEFRELAFVGVFIIILELFHVVSDVLSEDAVTVSLGVVLLGFWVVTVEAGFTENHEQYKIFYKF